MHRYNFLSELFDFLDNKPLTIFGPTNNVTIVMILRSKLSVLIEFNRSSVKMMECPDWLRFLGLATYSF